MRELEAREECARRGIDPDDICADGGVTAWMVVDQEWQALKTPPSQESEVGAIRHILGPEFNGR